MGRRADQLYSTPVYPINLQTNAPPVEKKGKGAYQRLTLPLTYRRGGAERLPGAVSLRPNRSSGIKRGSFGSSAWAYVSSFRSFRFKLVRTALGLMDCFVRS